jgi:polysaccharide deacetylase 2 family uncharacterized protein YibQ
LYKFTRLAGAIVAGLAASIFPAGCKKSLRKPSAAEIHAITKALTAEAAAQGATVRSNKSATDSDPNSRDVVHLKLLNGPSSSHAKAVSDLVRTLEQAATRNNLTEDQPVTAGNSMRILLRRSGFVTHEVQIETLPGTGTSGSARLAIILDDFGVDSAVADTVFAMHYPLTLSILPGHAHSEEIAQEAHRRGYEVMLHLPMESVGKEQPEAEELRPGMPTAQVSEMLSDFLARVPFAQGVNNHQGSEATSDTALMSELMPVLRDKGLFYIDSRTTTATVAYDTAQRTGVPSAFRNVPFLDDVEQADAIQRQLELAFRGAREKGEALAIGHPHAATLAALRESLPRARAEGIELVRASALVH